MLTGARPRTGRARIESFIREWAGARDGAGSELSDDDPLFLQSLEAADLGVLLEARLGVRAPLEDLLAGLTVGELAARLEEHADETETVPARTDVLVATGADRHEPFPLTAIQQAYLVGRSRLFELGGVSTHVYYEFDADDLDVARLEAAWRRVVARHDMLRAVVVDDGRQQVLKDVEPYRIQVADLRGLPSAEAERRLAAARDLLSHEVPPADRWPLFTIRVHRLDEQRSRIHLSLDLLVADGHSIALILRDWSALYGDPDAELPALDVTFRDYVQARSALTGTAAYAAARDYWLDRLDTLPPAPDLPLLHEPSTKPARFVRAPRFTRRELRLDAPAWAALRDRARELRLTPSGLLATVYAEVVGAWTCGAPHFTLNVTLGDRVPLHPHVGDVVGDFTSSVLLEVDHRGAPGFDERARRLRRRLARDLDHRMFSGVDVLREWARRDGSAPRMPVVFTSLLEAPDGDAFRGPFRAPGFAISQTPQVYLDHQVSERDGGLHLVWDCVEELFPAGMLDAMVETTRLRLADLSRAGDRRDAGPALPASELAGRRGANATGAPIPAQLLHEGIDRRAAERPDAVAIVAADRTLTYREVDERANHIARRLRELGVRPNELVAIVMEKGWQQAVAALAVVRAGAAYLPADAGLPARRLGELLEQGEVAVALTQAAPAARPDLPRGITAVAVDDEAAWNGADGAPLEPVAGPQDLAYVIFTSGSTGRPKGVMIEHRAAANTIVDCVERFGLGPRDRVLALSSLSFDLSVFDVFATLRAGGVLVVPEPGAMRNPARWAELVKDAGVTVWNSVPALLDMLVEFAAGRPGAVGESLRLAMLSGDWIPVDLPDRARELVPRLELVSMGGATEGSIWSVLHPIGDVDPELPSIPYGRPMLNQTMHVLDDDLEPRPVWVPGELYIGGVGVAAGYWRDPERTAERFLVHPRTGERLYRTGDLARYLPGGVLEFLGRQDHQVKIRGYRVELGEIEAALLEHPAIRAAVVVARGELRGPKRLVAYCVTDGTDLGACDLRRHLGARLPEYMVPQTYVPLERLPLSGNGKIDRGALPEPDVGATACAAPLPTPEDELAALTGGPAAAAPGRSDAEAVLVAVWQEVLGLERFERDQSFFDLGGDSLLAMRAIAKAGAAGLVVDPETFFAHPTIAEIAASAESAPVRAAEQGPLAGDAPLTPSQHWFFGQGFAGQDHWNGFWPLLAVPERLDPALLGAALHRVLVHHDALRTRFVSDPDAPSGWRAVIAGPDAASPVPFRVVDLSALEDPELTEAMEQMCAASQATLSLEDGPVLRLTYFDHGPDRAGRLHLAAHWAVMDYYSSRVLFEDLWRAYEALRDGRDAQLPPKTTSVVEYVRRLTERADDEDVRAELALWTDPARLGAAQLPVDHHDGPDDQASARQIMLMLDEDVTNTLLTGLPRETGCEVADPLLTAVVRSVTAWAGGDGLVVEIEAHGRVGGADGVDLSRTVGRCSSFAPLHLRASAADPPRASLAQIAAQVRAVPRRGLGHGLLRYLSSDETIRRALAEMPPPAVNFNFWGHLDEYLEAAILPIQESPGALQSPDGHRPRPLDVFGMVVAGQLALVFLFGANRHREETITQLAEATGRELVALAGAETDPDDVAPFTVVPFEASAFVRAEVA